EFQVGNGKARHALSRREDIPGVAKELVHPPAGDDAADMAAHQRDRATLARLDAALAIPFRQTISVGQESPDFFGRRVQRARKAHGAFGNDFAFHDCSFFRAASSASRRGVQNALMRSTQAETSATPSGSNV